MSDQSVEEPSPQRSRLPIPAFLIKTYEILEVTFKWKLSQNQQMDHVMSWASSGQGFVVKDQEQLCNQILPSYFGHKNYPSFLRQLNMYNFKKGKLENGWIEFTHKWFRRGGKTLLCHIRRRNQEDEEDMGAHSVQNLDEIEVFRKQQKDLKSDISQIMEMQAKLQQALSMILQQNDQLQNESKNLSKEIMGIEKKNQQRFDNYSMILQEIISKLQQESIFTEQRRLHNFDTNSILQILANDKRENEHRLPQMFMRNQQMQQNMQSHQQQLPMIYKPQNSQQLSLPYASSSPMNQMLSPYLIQSPYAQTSMSPKPDQDN